MQEYQIPKYKEQVIPQMENLLKSLVLLGLLVSSFFLAQAGVNAINSYFSDEPSPFHFVLKWSFVIVLALFNGVLMMGLAILGHEGLHGVLFKNKFLNDLWGGFLVAFVSLPFYDFRDFHFKHHAHTHEQGIDPEEFINNRPYWFSLTIGFYLALCDATRTILTKLFFGSLKHRWESLKDLFFLSSVGFLLFYLIPLAGPSIWYTSVPSLLLMPLVFAFRNVAEHHGLPPHLKNSDNRTENLDVDSWIVLTNPIMNWLWSSITYHQIHHRYPYLSHRYLKPIFEATQHDQPYAVVKGYLRSLMHLKTKKFYTTPEELKPFLVGIHSNSL